MFLFKLQIGVAIALAAAGFAQADSITAYSLSGNMNNGGVSISVGGQFDYDTTINTVTGWDLTISGPANAPFCTGAPTGTCYIFTAGGGASASFAADVFTFTSSSMAGNIDELVLAPNYSGPAPLPDGTYLLNSASSLITIGAGGEMGQAPFTTGLLVAAPEPGTLPLFLAALAAWTWRQRRRQTS